MKLLLVGVYWILLSAIGFTPYYAFYFVPRRERWSAHDDVRANGIMCGWLCFSLSLSTWIVYGFSWLSLIPLAIGGMNAYGASVKLRQMSK